VTEYLYATSYADPASANLGDTLNKYGLDGALIWSETVYDTEGFAQTISGLAVDASGYAYICGSFSYSAPTYTHVAKFTPAGAVAWAVKVLENANTVECIAVCPSGNVLIGFERESIGGDYYTVALLQAADGAVLWRADTGADSAVYKVASDTSNNCYAAGNEGTDTYSAWAFEDDGTPIWTDEGGLDNHTLAAVVYGSYLHVDAAYLGVPATMRLALADGVENTDLWPILLILAFDRFGRGYGLLQFGASSLVYQLPATLASVPEWNTAWTDADSPLSLAVSPDGYVFVCARLADTGDGIIRCYDAETGVEQGGNWPVSTVGYCDRVATTPGVYGAFPSAWLPAPHIYVGNVRYE